MRRRRKALKKKQTKNSVQSLFPFTLCLWPFLVQPVLSINQTFNYPAQSLFNICLESVGETAATGWVS